MQSTVSIDMSARMEGPGTPLSLTGDVPGMGEGKEPTFEEMAMKIFTDPPQQSVRGFRRPGGPPCAR